MHLKSTLTSFLLFMFIGLFAQSEEPKHQLNLGIGHSLIPSGVKTGTTSNISLPTWAIDYNYRISERFVLGLHNEIIVESFEYHPLDHPEAVLERSNPLASILVFGYRINEWMIYAGAGGEFSKEITYGMTRLGGEYAIPMPYNMECIIGINADLKWDAYVSYGITLGIAKNF